MATALIRKSTLAAILEVTYGVMPAMTGANVFSIWSTPNLNSNYDQVEDKTVRNTLSKWGTIRGAENVTGDISFPFKGSGTAGTAPPSSVLWECGMGIKNTSTASTTHGTTPCTTTSIVLVAAGGANFSVGDAVLIGGEVTWVTAKATDTLTVSPALTAAPGFGAAVGAGVHYKPSSAMKSFSARFWRGDITREDYLGLVAESLVLDFASGQIPAPKVTLLGQTRSAPVAQTYAASGMGAVPTESASPLVARNMVVTLGAVSYPVANIALDIKMDTYKRMAVTTSGVQEILPTARAVTGSFSFLYSDKTIDDVFLANTQIELRIVCGSTAGNIFAARIPKMRYTDVPKSEESGCYKYDVKFTSDPSNGEDELTSMSWL